MDDLKTTNEPKLRGDRLPWNIAPAVWLAIVTAAAAITFTGFGMLLRSRGNVFNADDPVFYYSYLRSAVHDGDLNLSNDYALCFRGSLRPSAYAIDPVTGQVDNNYTVGFPLLVAPFYIVGNFLFAHYYTAGDSPGTFPLFLDQMIYSYGSLLLGSLGIWMSFKFVSAYFPQRESLVATIAFWLCSPLIYYFGREPFMSHLASLFAASLLLYIWKVPSLTPPFRTLVVGMIAALVMMVRQQDIVILVIPIGSAVADGALRWPRRKLLFSALLGGLGFVAVFAIQMIVWHSLRGTFITYSYRGSSFEFLFAPKIASVLFSSNHGLLSWHPLIGLCLLGWLSLRHVDATMSWLALTCFALEVYIIASWWCWWMGYSFGNRGFLNLSPIFILGLAAFYTTLERRWTRHLFAVMVALLFVWNMTLMLAYTSELIPYEGEFSWLGVIRTLPGLPGQIVAKIHHIQP